MKMKPMQYIYDPKNPIREILYEGDYEGYHFYIVSYGMHPCAYVEIPNDHPWFERDYMEGDMDDYINCHGGVTFTDTLHHVLGEAASKGRWFIGWDYGHVGDFEAYYLDDPTLSKSFLDDKKWTTEEIYEEVKDVINQLNNNMDKILESIYGKEEVIKVVTDEYLIAESLKNNVRVNVSTRTVEFYNEFGVALVLRNLDDVTFEAYLNAYQNF